jgi:hypothetical protein
MNIQTMRTTSVVTAKRSSFSILCLAGFSFTPGLDHPPSSARTVGRTKHASEIPRINVTAVNQCKLLQNIFYLFPRKLFEVSSGGWPKLFVPRPDECQDESRRVARTTVTEEMYIGMIPCTPILDLPDRLQVMH